MLGVPTCSLQAAPLFAGEPGRLLIELVAEHDMRVSSIEITVGIDEGWAVGSGNHRDVNAITIPVGRWQVAAPGVLPAGTSRYFVDLVVPPIAPPTHPYAPAYARLTAFVHVAIPWWPDGRYRFSLQSRIRAPQPVVRAPVAVASRAKPGEPRLEIALASSRLIVGEALVGSCAVFHMDDREPREIALAFIPHLMLHGRLRTRQLQATPIVSTLTLPAGSAGTNVPFRLALPNDMTPSFSGSTHALAWFLDARVGSFFGTKADLLIPLEIVDSGALATTARLESAPTLAEERVAVLFTKFAHEHGWRIDDDDDTGAVSVVRELDGGTELHLAYAYRGEDGTFLVSRIASRSLGLGLLVTRSSSLRDVFFHDIEVAVAAWDRDHLVRARDADQAVPALRTVVDALVATAGLGSLLRWTDDELVFERSIVNPTPQDLAAIGAELARVAAAIDVAHAKVGPPSGLGVDLDTWRGLARWLDGTLCPGDLSITGTLAQAPVRLGLHFDEHDQPFALRASVGDPAQAGEATKAIAFALEKPASEALRVPPALTEVLLRWPPERTNLVVEDGVASASLPAASLDAASVRGLVEGLRAVVSTLAPDAAPYR